MEEIMSTSPRSIVMEHQAASPTKVSERNAPASTTPTKQAAPHSHGDEIGSSSDDLHDIRVTPLKHGKDGSASSGVQVMAMVEYPKQPSTPLNQLEIGDHVYQWRSLVGIPYMFQHHGIVVNISHVDPPPGSPTSKSKKASLRVTIADFSNLSSTTPQSSKSSSMDEDAPGHVTSSEETTKRRRFSLYQKGILRTLTDQDAGSWHKVHYEAPWLKRHVWGRSGTCTGASGDATGMVLARAHFILQHPEVIPPYHVFYANCECVAVWCKTGQWCTLQASSFLEYTAAGQLKSTSTLAAAAAHSQVTVPAAGLWGWLGYTKTVGLTTIYPWILPAVGAYGVVTVGIPALWYRQCHDIWKKTTKSLVDAFWESALENPDVFSESLAEWSQL